MTQEEQIAAIVAEYNQLEAAAMLKLAAMLALMPNVPGHMTLVIGGTPHTCPNNLDGYGRELWARAVLTPLDRIVEFRSR